MAKINLAKVTNGGVIDHGTGEEFEIFYSDFDGLSVVPIPNWAIELRENNIKVGKASTILKWDYETREFKKVDLGAFVK